MKLSILSTRAPRLACAIIVTVIGLNGPALAQYQWRDADNQMVFSDKPPPKSVKPSQVIRAQPMPPPPARSTPPTANDSPGQSAADRQLESRRKAEAAARKEAENAERAARTTRVCEQLNAEVRTLDSGMRIATILPNGERDFLSDEARQRRTSELRKNLSELCS